VRGPAIQRVEGGVAPVGTGLRKPHHPFAHDPGIDPWINASSSILSPPSSPHQWRHLVFLLASKLEHRSSDPSGCRTIPSRLRILDGGDSH